MSSLQIRPDDLTSPEIAALLAEHLEDMYAWSPPESVHALDLDALRHSDISFWSVWEGEVLMGCGALKELDLGHGEIKSMRTPRARRGRGAARMMLDHIIAVARSRGYRRLSLETGVQPDFLPARTLYEHAGFRYVPPFADYKEDPNSVFMSLELADEKPSQAPLDEWRPAF